MQSGGLAEELLRAGVTAGGRITFFRIGHLVVQRAQQRVDRVHGLAPGPRKAAQRFGRVRQAPAAALAGAVFWQQRLRADAMYVCRGSGGRAACCLVARRVRGGGGGILLSAGHKLVTWVAQGPAGQDSFVAGSSLRRPLDVTPAPTPSS